MKTTFLIQNLDELEKLTQDFKKEILNFSSEFTNQIFLLQAQMGSGKTTFIRSLIQNFSQEIKVTSPTFTGMHLYTGIDFDFYHYDLYQVALNQEEFREILDSDINKVIFFEWSENLDDNTIKSFTDKQTIIKTINIDVLEDEVRRFEISIYIDVPNRMV